MISVLIADDHPLVLRGVRDVVSAEDDIEIADEATNGHQVIEKIRQRTYDVVVLDISMPGLDGPETLRQMRSEGVPSPVLILSGGSEHQHAVRLIRAGAAGFVSKAAAEDDLVTAIRMVARGRKYISAATAEALAEYVGRSDTPEPHTLLSDREFAVLQLIASGQTVTEVAQTLHLSPATISTYRARILQKMQMRTNAELTHYAVKHRLV